MSSRPKRSSKTPSRFNPENEKGAAAEGGAGKKAKKVPVQRKSKKKTAGKRAKKDPNQPKRGKTAYIFYTQEARPKVKKENPDMTFGEISRLVSEQWKNMSKEDKAPYEEKAAHDKERYEREMKKYNKDNKKSEEEEEEGEEEAEEKAEEEQPAGDDDEEEEEGDE
jgi:hypothetical protein